MCTSLSRYVEFGEASVARPLKSMMLAATLRTSSDKRHTETHQYVYISGRSTGGGTVTHADIYQDGLNHPEKPLLLFPSSIAA